MPRCAVWLPRHTGSADGSCSARFASSDTPEVLATIGDLKITLDNVRARAGDQLAHVETQYRVVRSSIIDATLDSILRDHVLGAEAKKQGKPVDELLSKTTSSVAEPSDADVQVWFDSNQGRTGGRTLTGRR
ncbi:MAG TPA: hypothetical protein VLN59_04440 [Burkholderiales bacterium]|nr:hypothetical protein [Burkholderiales bacterium]